MYILRKENGGLKEPTSMSTFIINDNDSDQMSRSTLNLTHENVISSLAKEQQGQHYKNSNNSNVTPKLQHNASVIDNSQEYDGSKFALKQSSPRQIRSQKDSSTPSNTHHQVDHQRYEQEQDFMSKTSTIQKRTSPQPTSRVDQIMENHQLSSLSSLSPKSNHHNDNSGSKSNIIYENTNSLLNSITERLQQNIQQIERKIDSSQKDTEKNILNKNDSYYSKLEQSVVQIRNQHEDDSQKLQSAAHKIDNIMKSMMDHFKSESDKLAQKQLELTALQVSLIIWY